MKVCVKRLNQLFRISNKAGNRTGIDKKVFSIDEVGESVLGKVNINAVVNDIESGKHKYFDELDFKESIVVFSDYYQKDQYFNYPVSYSNCKACEFKATPEEEANGFKSGYKECWKKQHGWADKDFNKPNTFQVWNFRKGKKLFEQENKIFLEDIIEEDVVVKPVAGRISPSEILAPSITSLAFSSSSDWLSFSSLLS